MKFILFCCFYLILGIFYSMDIFHSERERVEEEGSLSLGELYLLTVFSMFMWPFFIIIIGVLDVRDER